MDDIERIQEMVAEGRISPEDGERLIAVLRDIDAADFALDSAAHVPPEPQTPEPPQAPEPPESPLTSPTPARPRAASELPEVAAPSPLLAAATESIERRRERFEEYERRRLERLHRDAQRRQEHAQRELDRLEREAQRETERTNREADRAARIAEKNAEKQAERDSAERERLKEAVRIATQAANEAAREVARRAQSIGKQAAEAAHVAAQEATQAARDLSQQATVVHLPQLPRPDENGDDRVAGPASQRRIAPAGTRWVTAEVLAGNFVVEAVPGLARPEVDRPDGVSIVETDYGFLIKQAPDRGSILDRFLAHVRSVDLKVRIPADHGLNLRATAGDIDLHGVKYLQGRVTAGDVSADGVEGIDFTTMAGEVDIELKLTAGDHAITCSTGDLEVTLSADSHVTIDGNVSIGEAHASHPAVSTERRTLGERVVGTLGSGAATLTMRVTTGELAVKVAGDSGYQNRSG